MAGFLAGAYIAIAGLLATVVSAGMPGDVWGGMATFVSGAVFSLGLILGIIAGLELLTGNMAIVPLAAMRGQRHRISPAALSLPLVARSSTQPAGRSSAGGRRNRKCVGVWALVAAGQSPAHALLVH